MKHYSTQTMTQIIDDLQDALSENEKVFFTVLNPDVSPSTYAGNPIEIDGQIYLYRGYKAWIDLAQLLFCKMLTPEKIDTNFVRLTFQKFNQDISFHTKAVEDKTEKYGIDSEFSLIHKSEEPAFVYSYQKALQAVKVGRRKRVLNLGINSGDEFITIKEMLEPEVFAKLDFTGIDHAISAIDLAKKRLPDNNMHFFAHDINHLDELGLAPFDLIITVGTLQSPSINFKTFFMSLVQNYLAEDGAMILGFPNCRWIDGEMVYGAKAPNYSYSEMSLVIKDIYYCKKYLQQHKFRVTITGKDYLFLVATSIRK